MRAFIVRPFGIKQRIDFELVQADLIAPALRRAGISGSTTAELVEAGNIRVDTFGELLMADLVIADISVHNANVFYELGIRHSFRPRQTILIRSDSSQSEIAFDLRTDRYVVYNAAHPSASVDALLNVIGQTRTGERVDSPVFLSLPGLKECDRSLLTPLPREFREELTRAGTVRRSAMVGLLGWEAQGFSWETEGKRLVGRELFKLRAFAQARYVWTEIRNFEPLDREANLMLGIILQRVGDLAGSDQALDRLLRNPSCSRSDRTEAYTLLGRNDKTRWQAAWQQTKGLERRRAALRSKHLMDSYQRYRSAFLQDLNHYYSGLNALSLLTIVLELITAEPDEWVAQFETDVDAEVQRRSLQKQCADLSGTVGMALETARAQLPQGESDIWLDISFADYRFLTVERTGVIRVAYEAALTKASSFHLDSSRAQLQLFEALGIFNDRVQSGLSVVPDVVRREYSVAPAIERAVLFTGHMTDAPWRFPPRFSADQEQRAREAIRTALLSIVRDEPQKVAGIAAASSGGDILFHEVCAELGIRTRVRLALPPQYTEQSVALAGQQWLDRFNKIVKDADLEILSESPALPQWLQRKGGYDIWQRSNMWLLQEALAVSAPVTELITLWDGHPGDRPGGVEQMVELARERGLRTTILDTRALFAL